MNYKLLATQFGESIKYETSINEIGRVFSALTDLKLKNYTNESITSSRSQLIYSWVLTIGNSNLPEAEKINLIKQAILSLVANKEIQERFISLRGKPTQSPISILRELKKF